jgi:hypothetical protein
VSIAFRFTRLAGGTFILAVLLNAIFPLTLADLLARLGLG